MSCYLFYFPSKFAYGFHFIKNQQRLANVETLRLGIILSYQRDTFVETGFICTKINGEYSGICKWSIRRINCIGKSMFLPENLIQFRIESRPAKDICQKGKRKAAFVIKTENCMLSLPLHSVPDNSFWILFLLFLRHRVALAVLPAHQLHLSVYPYVQNIF